jgi:RimJ/RimL family protein N-acetyltransferase
MTGSMPFHQLVLNTPRLRLRPLVASDAGALFDLCADREVMRYWSTPPWTTLAQAEALIAADLAELPTGRHLRLALLPCDGERLIGTCSLFSFNLACRRAEIGYALARNAWGQGLMHEALVALVDHAFGALQLHRLEADIDPRNTASAASLARLGFAKEGHLRERWIVDGVVSDSALYGLLRSDWLAQGLHSDAARNI